MQDPDDTIHSMQEEINELQTKIAADAELYRQQLDKAQSQILTLRLIADRAVSLLLSRVDPSIADMSDEQGKVLATYLETSECCDMAEVDSAEQALIDLVVKPLNQLAAGEPETIDLLKLAMREIEREKSIQVENRLIEEVSKSRPDLKSLCEISRRTLMFALMAGRIEEPNLRDYSPACMLAATPRPQ